MKTWLLFLAWIGLLGPSRGWPAAGDSNQEVREKEQLLIIVNRANPIHSLTKDQVRQLFLRRELTWEEPIAEDKVEPKEQQPEPFDPKEKVLPIELTTTKEHAAFLARVLEKDKDTLERHWIKLQYQSAVNRPRRVGTSERVIKYTASLKGCIGYINARDLDERAKKHVKVVLVLEM